MKLRWRWEREFIKTVTAGMIDLGNEHWRSLGADYLAHHG
jgi:hypothetical protein